MKKKWFITIIIIVIVCVTLITELSHSSATNKAKTVKVTKGTIKEKVVAVGNITPKQLIEVKSPISGTIAKLYHDDGDYVTAGEPLFEIQPQPTPSDFAAAKQKVASDQVILKNALTSLNSYKFLLKNKAISPVDKSYQQAIETYRTSKLNLELAKEQLALLKKGKTTIAGQQVANIVKSPISGYVLQRNVDLGGAVIGESSAQAGSTIFTIANMQHLMFKGQISEIDASKIHTGMPATIKIAALPKQKVQGILTNIALQSVQAAAKNDGASSNSSSSSSTSPFNVGFQVKITHLKIPKTIKLLAGYSATASIVVQTAKNVMTLPETALQFSGNKTYVWVPGKNNKPKKQFIKVGLSNGMQVQVLSGLQMGETIFTSGPKKPA